MDKKDMEPRIVLVNHYYRDRSGNRAPAADGSQLRSTRVFSLVVGKFIIMQNQRLMQLLHVCELLRRALGFPPLIEKSDDVIAAEDLLFEQMRSWAEQCEMQEWSSTGGRYMVDGRDIIALMQLIYEPLINAVKVDRVDEEDVVNLLTGDE